MVSHLVCDLVLSLWISPTFLATSFQCHPIRTGRCKSALGDNTHADNLESTDEGQLPSYPSLGSVNVSWGQVPKWRTQILPDETQQHHSTTWLSYHHPTNSQVSLKHGLTKNNVTSKVLIHSHHLQQGTESCMKIQPQIHAFGAVSLTQILKKLGSNMNLNPLVSFSCKSYEQVALRLSSSRWMKPTIWD